MTDLPILEEHRIDEMEHALFATIARERAERGERDAAARRRRRRRTAWLTSAAAAAVLVAAVAVGGQLTTSTGSAGSAAPAAPAAPVEDGVTAEELAPFAQDPGGSDATGRSGTADASAAREVVATASATVRVADPASAAQQIADAAAAAGGYLESLSVGGSTVQPAEDAATAGSAWVSVRVPAASLEDVVAGLADLGDVESSQVSRDDVTTQAADLRARVAAGQASVERLTTLLSQAGSVADLIAAEAALAERQADLESLQQQLTALKSQVALSSLSVQLEAPRTVDADPAGFTDGLIAGWNGLVAAMNGVIVGLGFTLPWLAVLAVAALVVRLLLATVRRGRGRRSPSGD